MNRRDWLRHAARGGLLLAIGGGAGWLTLRRPDGAHLWQIDPRLCERCGRCETHCVQARSAVRCVNVTELCGRCRFCFGYYETAGQGQSTAGGEQRLCPTDALRRERLSGPYYEYGVARERCVGCGRCVKGCERYGNASLFLQIQHDLCRGCNECAIAAACPVEAIQRLPRTRPYRLKKVGTAS